MDDLSEEISAEREHISKTLNALRECLEREEKSIVELAAIATFIHNTYNGMENTLKRIFRFKEIGIPSSESSHRDLLNFSVEHGIISLELSEELDEYRAFRHFFVHGYGIMLDEHQLTPLAENLAKVWEKLESELTGFLDSLKRD